MDVLVMPPPAEVDVLVVPPPAPPEAPAPLLEASAALLEPLAPPPAPALDGVDVALADPAVPHAGPWHAPKTPSSAPPQPMTTNSALSPGK
jgi:hypothetical protein